MKITVQQKARLSGHTGSIYALERMQHRFFSGSGDGIVALWDINKTESGDAYFRASNGVYSIKHLPDLNKLLIGTGAGSLYVINMDSGQEEKLLQLHASHIFSILYNKQYNVILTGGGDGKVTILDSSFALLQIIQVSENKIRCFSPSVDGSECFIGSSDGKISILSLPSFTIKKQWQAHAEGFGVNCIGLSPDGKYILSGSRDARLNIYNASLLELIESIPAHNYAIYDIAFHSSGKFFATAGRDKAVKLWDAATFKVIDRMDKDKYDGHNNSVNKILWMDDYLVTGGDDRSIIIWELENCE